jgi:hypothetical protein
LFSSFNAVGTSNYLAAANGVYGIFLFLFNCGPFVFSEHKKFEKKLYELKAENMTEEEKDAFGKAKSSFHSRSGSIVSGVGSSHNRVATKTIYVKPRNNHFTLGNSIENTRLN